MRRLAISTAFALAFVPLAVADDVPPTPPVPTPPILQPLPLPPMPALPANGEPDAEFWIAWSVWVQICEIATVGTVVPPDVVIDPPVTPDVEGVPIKPVVVAPAEDDRTPPDVQTLSSPTGVGTGVTETPEPATLSLLAVGGLAALAYRRKR